MSLNNITIEGKIISDIRTYGEESNEFVSFILGFSKNYKLKDQQYPDSLTIACKAFKSNAVFISKYFTKQSHIIIVGSIDQNSEYTDKDGNLHPAEFCINVEKSYFAGEKPDNISNNKAENQNAAQAAPATPVINKPFAGIANNNSATINKAPTFSPIKKTSIGGR